MLPIDIVDFMQVVSTLGGDLVMYLIVAALKEPLATAKFLELVSAGENPLLRRTDYTGEEIGKVLEKVAQCLDGCPNKTEVQQLSRQGVARFVGPASLIRSLGVIAVTTTSPENQNSTGEQDNDGKYSVPPAKKKEERRKGRSRQRDSPCCVAGLWTAKYEVGHLEARVHVHTRLHRIAEVHRGVQMF
jgi:hypothetical protein